MTASAVVIPLTRIFILRSSSIDPDSSRRPLEAQHRPSVYPLLPLGPGKKLSALFARDNSLHCSGCRLSFCERERGEPHPSSVYGERQYIGITADVHGVLPE